MKVSKFFRYFLSILSILAVVLGIVYFAMYYSSEDFISCYGVWDTLVMEETINSVIITVLINCIYLLAKDNTQRKQKKPYIKNTAKIYIPILVIGILCAFILGGDAFYIQIALLLLDILFLIVGDMFEYSEIRDVVTTFEVE